MSKIRIEFCGAFNGTVTRRPGETAEQLHRRVEDAINNALDRGAKRYGVNAGVDFGDLELTLSKVRRPGRPRRRRTPRLGPGTL